MVFKIKAERSNATLASCISTAVELLKQTF